MKVNVDFEADGKMTPRSVTWADGNVFEIDRVLSHSHQTYKAKRAGIGMRYTVGIGKRTTYIYYEEPAWFVEGKEGGAGI